MAAPRSPPPLRARRAELERGGGPIAVGTMNAAWISTRASWRTHRGALLALALLIALGTATSLTALAGARRTATVVDRFIATDKTAHAIIQLNSTPVERVDALRRIDDVTAVSIVSNTVAFPEHSPGYVPLLTS